MQFMKTTVERWLEIKVLGSGGASAVKKPCHFEVTQVHFCLKKVDDRF